MTREQLKQLIRDAYDSFQRIAGSEYDADLAVKVYCYPLIQALFEGTEHRFEDYMDDSDIIFSKEKLPELLKLMGERIHDVASEALADYPEWYLALVAYGFVLPGIQSHDYVFFADPGLVDICQVQLRTRMGMAKETAKQGDSRGNPSYGHCVDSGE